MRIKINYEKGTDWITVKSHQWLRNDLPSECIDKFGEVWLRPIGHTNYETVDGKIKVICTDVDGYLELVEMPNE